MISLLRWLMSLLRRPPSTPESEPIDHAPRTVVAACSRCGATFLAHCGPVDAFDPQTILDDRQKIVCLRCRRGGR